MSDVSGTEIKSVPAVNIDRLGGRVRRGVFACGNSEIDGWGLDAHKHHVQLKTRVWSACLVGNVLPVGLYGLRIRLEPDDDIDGHNGTFRSESNHFAAVQLCYLGVQRTMQRRGIGSLLMAHAIREFGHVADRTGICAMTLVAINAERAEWYESLGFRRYGAECQQPKMFLPAQSAIDLL